MYVVFPEPFGPIRAWASPRRTTRSTPSTATRPPKRLTRLLNAEDLLARGAPAPHLEIAPAAGGRTRFRAKRRPSSLT